MTDCEYFESLYTAAKDFTMKAYYANILSQYEPVGYRLNAGVSTRPAHLMQKIYDRMV